MIASSKTAAVCALIAICIAFPLHAEASPQASALKHKLEQQLGAYGRIQKIEIDSDLGTPALLSGVLSKPSRHTPEWIAYDFLREVRTHYGLIHPLREMLVKEKTSSTDGGSIVKLQQLLFNTPVYGGQLEIQVDRDGVVRRVEGTVYPGLEEKLFHRRTYPVVSSKKAVRLAKASYRGEGELSSKPVVTRYYLPDRPGTPLVYEVIFEIEGAPSPYRVLIHAVMGHIIP
ncbi:Zn-dependent metalloprotease [Paenibacillus phyllosphaerae]|uniref:Zn-dependent metalloprotease n=1 Tax=Paenibacillus phyllosphaerae TaxID=274593 RepID=A0A7W5B4N2_9BACL|nr:hypothetical protein [Paenibacillus phyllosphaerae]MBB3113866.1 Zn-dependent metalloprotease [Paenibacillus phyllosphaerae]